MNMDESASKSSSRGAVLTIKQVLFGTGTASFHVLSMDEKLLLLTKCLSAVEKPGLSQTEDPQCLSSEEGRLQWTNFLRNCLLYETDKYVLFAVRKLLSKMIRLGAIEEDFILLDHILTLGPDHLHLIGLQICSELFSNKSTSTETLILELGPSVLKSCRTLTTFDENITNMNSLYELFSVFKKVFKHAWKAEHDRKDDVLLSFLKSVLKLTEEVIQILFTDKTKKYVIQKLIKFLCFILKNYKSAVLTDVKTETFQLASVLFKNFECSVVSVDCGKNMCSTFTGKPLQDEGDAPGDVVNKGLWIFLYFCTSDVLIQAEENLVAVVSFLLRLDKNVKEILNMKCTVLFPCLPHLYGDQDDMWIDAMELLLDIFTLDNPVVERVCPESRNQHHIHFLQFARIIGYDYSVLIDLLTSPETNFLSYFVKYLKHLVQTWNLFNLVTTDFRTWIGQTDDECVADIDDVSSNNEVVMSDTFVYSVLNKSNVSQNDDSFKGISENSYLSLSSDLKQPSLSRSGNHICSLKIPDFKSTVRSTEAEVIDKKFCKNGPDNGGSSHKQTATNLPDNESEFIDQKVCTLDCFHQGCDCSQKTTFAIKGSHTVHAPCTKGGSLTMIVNAYASDDDSNNDYDYDDDNGNEAGAVNRITDENVDSYDDYISHMDTENYTGSKHLAILSQPEHPSQSHVIESRMDEDTRVLSNKEYEAVGRRKDSYADSVLDKVMGMMIRTRLKLEKLWSSGLMQYDPAVLTGLLDKVEELYEDS